MKIIISILLAIVTGQMVSLGLLADRANVAETNYIRVQLEFQEFRDSYDTLLKNVVSKQKKINRLSSTLEDVRVIRHNGKVSQIIMEATAYTASEDETDGDPNVTAMMEAPIPGKTCAVSRKYRKIMGKKKVYVEGVGVLRVNDVMNKRITNGIDIVMASKDEANQFGHKLLRVVLLE